MVNKIDIDAYTSGYSFYVELANFESVNKVTTLARSGTVTYDQLAGHIGSDLLSVSSVSPWHASNYQAIPEPTTGLMLLLGLSLVSLKRRKV